MAYSLNIQKIRLPIKQITKKRYSLCRSHIYLSKTYLYAKPIVAICFFNYNQKAMYISQPALSNALITLSGFRLLRLLTKLS